MKQAGGYGQREAAHIWSCDEIKLLKENAHLKKEELEKMFKLPIRKIRDKANRENIDLPNCKCKTGHRTDKNYVKKCEQARQLLLKGMSVPEVSERVAEVSLSTIYRIKRELGTPIVAAATRNVPEKETKFNRLMGIVSSAFEVNRPASHVTQES